jgi:hypothetical protein
MPDFIAYHKSLNAELTAIKDRVRNLIQHWPTDGSFKESVLRNILKRHLPESLFIGTGFVVTETACSKQIDVLILDKDCPRLFWDGDLVIVTPDAVRAAIEVKTGLNSPSEIESVILKAAEDRASWYRTLFGCNNIFALFVYEERGDHEEAILQALYKAWQQYQNEDNCVVYGNDIFVDSPGQICSRNFQGWVSRRTEGMAAACLISKLISYFSRMSIFPNQSAWQPLMRRDSVFKYLPMHGSGNIETVTLESCITPLENREQPKL